MSTPSVSGTESPSALAAVVEVRLAKMSNDQTKAEGEAALKLIQGAKPQPPAAQPDGRGAVLNGYA